jgi:uncharacterized protein (TIGR00299 family) protein
MPEILYLEPIGGIAGDMFLAAALDLGVPRERLERALAGLDVPGFRLEVTTAEDGGVRGTHVDVVVEGPQPHHRALSDILALVERSALPPRAKEAAAAVFRRIGEAEAKVHGVSVEEVHFHEVGAVDSIVDVCGAAVVLDLLRWPRVVCAPPELGQGFVKTAHGRLPVPPPAVLEILRGVEVRPGGPPGEAVTPTGAALLAVLADVGRAPVFAPRRVGVGIGTARWPDRPNALRMTLGDEAERAEAIGAAVPDPLAPAANEATPLGATSGAGSVPDSVRLDRRTAPAGVEARASGDAMVLLESNLDDCPGQLVARAIEAALEVGAVDAWATPCTMKKGRPGVVLAALAPAGRVDAVARTFAAETTTLGVRIRPVERIELEREHVAVETPYGSVRVKVGRLAGEVLGAHPEYDDCLARAREHRVAVKEVMAAALAGWRSAGGTP